MKRAVYAGSFDPLTKGHLWVIQEGSKLFDELIVAVGISPDKHYTFSTAERLEMLKECIPQNQYPNVRRESFGGMLLINYAKSIGAGYILRGIRTAADYEYERMLRYVNSDMCADIKTVYLIPPREIAEVSSSLVRNFVGTEGWKDIIGKYIPEPVYKRIVEKMA